MASMAKPGPTVNFLAEIAWRFLDLRPTCLSFSYVTDAVCLYGQVLTTDYSTTCYTRKTTDKYLPT